MNSPTRLLISVIVLFIVYQVPAQEKPDLDMLLPSGEVLGDFALSAEVERYTEDELFFLINGGADLFLEYGFNSVIKADYAADDHVLIVEIYEMKDPPAAFGMYSMMQMKDEEPDSIGYAGQILNDHALFAKGKYLVKLNTNLSDTRAEEVMKAVSNDIASKIIVGPYTPVMTIQLMPVTNYDLPELKYFKGSLGLNNIYPLSSKDIYNFTDGAAGIYQDFKVIILNCNNAKESLLQFGMIADMVSSTLKYSDFKLAGKEFTAIDNLGNRITANLYENYVYLIIHSKQMNISPVRKEIQINIDLITM